MKYTSDTQVVSNLGTGRRTPLSFDQRGTAQLMEILGERLYGNAPEAVLREYGANALDSHVEAGNPNPILVTLPDEWDENLVIQDFGVGLSSDEIHEVYTKYGNSSKTNNNKTIGSMGIGSKSAYAIGSQFVVTGVKDGVKSSSLFSLDENGVGVADELFIAPTNEPNGVTISIAVKDYKTFSDAAANVFRGWEPGTVLVNGQAPESIWNKMLKVNDNVYTAPGNGYITVVMGGIAYPADYSMLRKVDYSGVYATWSKVVSGHITIAAKVGMSAVDFTPAREALRDTPKTLAVLRDILVSYDADIKAAVVHFLDKEPTITHAAQKAQEALVYTDSKKLSWRGTPLSDKIEVPLYYITTGYSRRGSRKGYANYKMPLELGRSDLSNITVLVNVTNKPDYVSRVAAKVMSGISTRWVIADPLQSAEHEWFTYGGKSLIPVVDYATLKEQYKATLPSYQKSDPVYTTNNDEELTPAELNDLDEEIAWIKLSKDTRNVLSGALFQKCFEDKTVVYLEGAQSPTVFAKRVTKAVEYTKVLKNFAQDLIDNLSQGKIDLINFRHNNDMDKLKSIAEAMNKPDVFGDDLVKYAGLKSTDEVVDQAEVTLIRQAFNTIGRGYELQGWDEIAAGIYKKFPLLSGVTSNYNYNYKTGGYRYTYTKKDLKHACLYVEAVLGCEDNEPQEA